MRFLPGAVALLAACGSAELNMQMATGGGTAGGFAGGAAGGQAEGSAGGSAGGSAVGATAGGAGGGVAAVDPCPALPIPATCFGGRKVVFREWGPAATGDGTYFAEQAPGRLGFNRLQSTVWIVKFRTEADTYYGRISAYGNTGGSMSWISDKPCDPTFAIDRNHLSWGGGTLDFVVTRNTSDATALAAQSSTWHSMPQLEANHCYYAVFENWRRRPAVSPPPLADFDVLPDGCGSAADPSCYYLAFDMDHRLHDLDGNTLGSHVIAGFTQGP